MDLSKSQKQIARVLIHRALERECGIFLENVDDVLHREKTECYHQRYLELYKMVQDFDKHVAFRYDRLSGSHYLEAVADLFCSKVLSQEDIDEFDEDVRLWLMRLKESLNG